MVEEPVLRAAEIQGSILPGFATQRLALAGFVFEGPEPAIRLWLRELGAACATLASTRSFRTMRRARIAHDSPQVNITLSSNALRFLGFPVDRIFDAPFRAESMGRLASALGDGDNSEYVVGANRQSAPDALVLIGSDADEPALRQSIEALTASASGAGLRRIYLEIGARLPNDEEHFGFRDNISQVGVRGRASQAPDDYVTRRRLDPADPLAQWYSKPGQLLIWPGQFLFGYPTHVPSRPLEPGAPSKGGRDSNNHPLEWMNDGSLLVFRRLRQKVAAFRSFSQNAAATLTASLGRTVSDEHAQALMVGRWKDGTALVASPDAPAPAISADELWVNHFGYAAAPVPAISVEDGRGGYRTIPAQPGDEIGVHCPHFAHVRKVNPRNLSTDFAGRSVTAQMLRRGITYGPPYRAGAADEDADRGLLFLSFQTSIQNQFLFLNGTWMNNPDAPEDADDGFDLLVGQNPTGGPRFCRFLDANRREVARLQTPEKFVISTGGGFFFAPSISFFRSL